MRWHASCFLYKRMTTTILHLVLVGLAIEGVKSLLDKYFAHVEQRDREEALRADWLERHEDPDGYDA